MKSSLDIQQTKVNGKLPEITDKKVHKFLLNQVGKKRKIEPVDDDQVINVLKKH